MFSFHEKVYASNGQKCHMNAAFVFSLQPVPSSCAMIWYDHGAATSSSLPIIAFALTPTSLNSMSVWFIIVILYLHQHHYKSKHSPPRKADTMFSKYSNISSVKNETVLPWKVPNHVQCCETYFHLLPLFVLHLCIIAFPHSATSLILP